MGLEGEKGGRGNEAWREERAYLGVASSELAGALERRGEGDDRVDARSEVHLVLSVAAVDGSHCCCFEMRLGEISKGVGGQRGRSSSSVSLEDKEHRVKTTK